MIRKNVFGVSPDLEIVVGDVPVNYDSIGLVELHLSENQHDMLILRMVGLPSRAMVEYRNKGVRVRIDTGASYKQEFYGYVRDIRPVALASNGFVNNSPFQEVDLICLGASYSMRSKRSQNWSNYRISDIAADYCNKYRFSLDTLSPPPLNTLLAQTNESDWKFLVRYANKLGLSVNVHGTHMHIYDPFQAVSRATSYHKLLTVTKTRGGLQPSPGQVMEFRASISQRYADGQYIDTIVTVASDDYEPYDVTTKELERPDNGKVFYQNRISEYANNYDQATRIIDSTNKQDYDFYATVTCLGLAGCVPGGVVDLDEYDSEFDGLWYVQSVKHTIHSSAFLTELQLARNLNSQLVPTNIQAFRSPPKPVFIDGAWVTSTRLINEYS
jgi:phage protein D